MSCTDKQGEPGEPEILTSDGEPRQIKPLSVSPVHTPMRLLMGAPKSQYRPLCGSHTSFSVHSSPICLAHTLQQPQPSSTRLTPGAHWGGADGHEHWLLHS